MLLTHRAPGPPTFFLSVLSHRSVNALHYPLSPRLTRCPVILYLSSINRFRINLRLLFYLYLILLSLDRFEIL